MAKPRREVTIGWRVTALAFRGKTEAFGCADGAVVVPGVSQDSRKPEGHRGEIEYCLFSKTGSEVITAGKDGTLRVWDAATGAQRHQIARNQGYFLSFALSPDGTSLAATSGLDRLRCWNYPDRQLLSGSNVGSGVRLLFTHGDDRLYTVHDAHRECRVERRDVETGHVQPVCTFPIAGSIYAASLDHPTLVVVCKKQIEWWDVTQPRLLSSLQIPDAHPDGTAISPCNQLVAVPWKAGRIRLWKHGVESVWRILDLGPLRPSVLRFTPDSRYLVVGCEDGKLVVVETLTCGEALRLDAQRAKITALDVSRCGKYVVTACGDGTATVWDLARACSDPTLRPTPEAVQRWLGALGRGDAACAASSLWQLARTPDLPLSVVERELNPAVKIDQAEYANLLRGLDSREHRVRQAATERLFELGVQAVPLLTRDRASAAPEAKRRIEDVLDRLGRGEPSSRLLREARLVQLLEMLNTPGSRARLRLLATGAPEAEVTLIASRALERLRQIVR